MSNEHFWNNCQEATGYRPIPSSQNLNPGSTIAQALIEALKMQSDHESSAILAAIRVGVPLENIHQALSTVEYTTDGLANVLESQRTINTSST